MWNLFFRPAGANRFLDEAAQESWREIIHRKVPIYVQLPPAEQSSLEQAVKVIMAERTFEGLRGFEITDDVAVTIAAQAALLLLAEEGYFFERVSTILVQDGNHLTRVAHSLGSAVLIEEDVLAAGQASIHGEIRLNWDEVQAGAADPTTAKTSCFMVAHHLGGLDGEMDGMPPLPTTQARRHWQDVFDQELSALRRELRSGGEPFCTTPQPER
jgi:Mlc titration factor MtfA (ptsG expression regulator)